jgi:hypothetical protein
MNCDWSIKPKNRKIKILHLHLKISVNLLPKKENKILKAKLYWTPPPLSPKRGKGKENRKRNRHCRRRRQTVRRMAAAPLPSSVRLLRRLEASLARFLTRASPFAAAESVETAARFCLSMDMMNASHPKAFATNSFWSKDVFSVTQRERVFYTHISRFALCFLGERVYM